MGGGGTIFTIKIYSFTYLTILNCMTIFDIFTEYYFNN